MPHDDNPYGPPDDWEEDFYSDWDEEEADPHSCDNCGPWCPDWVGAGLCMIAIRSMADEYEAEEYERKHPLAAAAWRLVWRLYAFLSAVLSKILPARCPGCGKFYIFGGDHNGCLPF